MKKIKILDTLESIKATAEMFGVGVNKAKMFGNTYCQFEFTPEKYGYNIEGLCFRKESCEIIEVDDRPILSGDQPEFAYYELSDDKEHWTQEAYLILGYDKAAPDPYFNGEEWYAYARKVEL